MGASSSASSMTSGRSRSEKRAVGSVFQSSSSLFIWAWFRSRARSRSLSDGTFLLFGVVGGFSGGDGINDVVVV